ncbi:uncharacterized protein [Palaemon carinicauda]|uniref:uncharacterized protein n=1 Tax=Palaemon carinicauda TaxID=392227 RepID=UPI0035B5FF42
MWESMWFRILLLITASNITQSKSLVNSTTEREYDHDKMVSSSMMNKICPRCYRNPSLESLNHSSLSFRVLCHLVCFTYSMTSESTKKNTSGKQYSNRRRGIFSKIYPNDDLSFSFKTNSKPHVTTEKVVMAQSDSKFDFDEYSMGKNTRNLGNLVTDAITRSVPKTMLTSDPLAKIIYSKDTLRHNTSNITDFFLCGRKNPQAHLKISLSRSARSSTIQPVKNSKIYPIKAVDNFPSLNISATFTYQLHTRSADLPLFSLLEQFRVINKILTAVESDFNTTLNDNYTREARSPTLSFKTDNLTIPTTSLNYMTRSYDEFLKHPGKMTSGVRLGNIGETKHVDYGNSSRMNGEEEIAKYTLSGETATDFDLSFTNVNARPMSGNNILITLQRLYGDNFLLSNNSKEKITNSSFHNLPRRKDFNIQQNSAKRRLVPIHLSPALSINEYTVQQSLPHENVSVYYSDQPLPAQESTITPISRAFLTVYSSYPVFQEPFEFSHTHASASNSLDLASLPVKSPVLFSSMSSSLSPILSVPPATKPLGSLQSIQTKKYLTQRHLDEKTLSRSRRTVVNTQSSLQPGFTTEPTSLHNSSVHFNSSSNSSVTINPPRQLNITIVQTPNTAVLNFLSSLGPLELESENIRRDDSVMQVPCLPISNCIRRYGDHPLDYCIYGFLPSCQEGHVSCLDNYFGPFNELCLNESLILNVE